MRHERPYTAAFIDLKAKLPHQLINRRTIRAYDENDISLNITFYIDICAFKSHAACTVDVIRRRYTIISRTRIYKHERTRVIGNDS